ncbi:MAG: PQQ-binding-like beta-propeller repeat protein [Nannocystaceae bacterium]|nr:PQQ-binding-like beta-propeller repeat protein [Nannocystaceae bacterium]
MSEALRGPATTPRLRWSIDVAAVVTGRPLVLGGSEPSVVVASHSGRVVRAAIADGRVRYDVALDGIVWSSPAVDPSGSVWIGADDDTLYRLGDDGVVRSRVRLGDCEPPRAAGPEGTRCDVDGGPVVLPDGEVFVGADGVYRIAPDGTIRWRSPGDRPARHVATAPLVTDALVVWGGYDGNLTAVDREGKPQWSLRIGADVDGAPVLAGDRILAGADDGKLYAVDRRGALSWSFATKGPIRAAAAIAGDGSVLVPSSDGKLYALEPSGTLRWSFTTGGAIVATPTLDVDGNVYFGSRDDRLWSLSDRGALRWSLEFPADLDAPVALAPGGVLVVACDDGIVRAVAQGDLAATPTTG